MADKQGMAFFKTAAGLPVYSRHATHSLFFAFPDDHTP
jgi:hypothetical protein